MLNYEESWLNFGGSIKMAGFETKDIKFPFINTINHPLPTIIDKISGVMIALDEEHCIEAAITKLNPWVDEIVLLDGGSKDKTVELVKNLNLDVRIYQFPFTYHFGDQKNMAMSLANYPWILFLDPDEYLEGDTPNDLRKIIKEAIPKHDCLALTRKNFIDGKYVGDEWQLRFHRSFCRYFLPLHEELVGWKSRKNLTNPYIVHKKTSKHQEKQNQFYAFLEKATLNKTMWRLED